jgi:predicted ester cyclase
VIFEQVIRGAYGATACLSKTQSHWQSLHRNFNEQNPAIAGEIFAHDFSARLPGAPTVDREGWNAFLGIFRGGFPDLHLKGEDRVATDERLIIRVILHGTHQSDFQGMVPIGKRVAFTGIAMFRIADGQADRRRRPARVATICATARSAATSTTSIS